MTDSNHEAGVEAVKAELRDMIAAYDQGAGPWPAERFDELLAFYAKEAIAAYTAAALDGWKMVPREPTEAMHLAGMQTRQMQDNLNKAHNVIIDTSDVWRAMWDALPAASSSKGK